MDVVLRMRQKFGLGDCPEIRIRVYRRIARAVEVHGDPVLRVIAQVEDEAASKDTPDRWFVAAIMLRLRSLGFLGTGRGEERKERAETVVNRLGQRFAV